LSRVAPLPYVVLARKYRPKTFDDLVGQEAIAKGLAQAIASGRIGHAFLFVGSRGTGKTSSARILAKALNCAKGPTASPCGKCESCQAIEDGTDVDVLEIDAASNNSVDNVRELRERVGFAPMRGRYRITILDEVHMLSTGAFNALLKTLEEPPSHAKFIFATTAPEKIPDTIRSRCQVHEFRRIDVPAIVKRLTEICKLESVRVPEPILVAIANASRGGMRDSLSLLDQLLAYAGASPTEADLAALTGAAGREAVAKLADAVIDGDRSEVLKRVAEHARSGGEAEELLDQLIERFRAVLVVGLCGLDTDVLDEPPAVRASLDAQSKRAGPDRAEAVVKYLVNAREKARFMGPLVRAWIESALLSASRSGEVGSIPALLTRLEELERRLEAPGAAEPPVGAAPVHAPAAPPASRGSAGSPPQPAALLGLLAEKNAFGRTVKERAVQASLDGSVLTVTLAPLDAKDRAILLDSVNVSTAERHLGERVPGLKLNLKIAAAGAATAARGAAPKGPASDPAAGVPVPDASELTPAVKFVLEKTGGRILGRTRIAKPAPGAAAAPPAAADSTFTETNEP
jgi:DNA polymerase-3 subunit gamma/tau